jgi:uncharacterized protein
MAVTRQLYELQELDTEIEHAEQNLALKNGQLGSRRALENAQNAMAAEKKRSEELKHARRDTETQAEDLSVKIKAAEQQLYGGTIKNPKELANLQHEIKNLKAQRDPLETKSLEIDEQIEAAEKNAAALSASYVTLEATWQQDQQQLAVDIGQIKKTLEVLKEKRREAVESIPPAAMTLYENVRNKKKPAVTKVEQGICRACRLSVSASILQKARGGQAVQCGTCGRIMFVS